MGIECFLLGLAGGLAAGALLIYWMTDRGLVIFRRIDVPGENWPTQDQGEEEK